MVFYETDIFTEQIVEFLDDDSYRELQSVLIRDPESGDLIPRSRGLRKIRWRVPGRGKLAAFESFTISSPVTRFTCSLHTPRTNKKTSPNNSSSDYVTSLTNT